MLAIELRNPYCCFTNLSKLYGHGAVWSFDQSQEQHNPFTHPEEAAAGP